MPHPWPLLLVLAFMPPENRGWPMGVGAPTAGDPWGRGPNGPGPLGPGTQRPGTHGTGAPTARAPWERGPSGPGSMEPGPQRPKSGPQASIWPIGPTFCMSLVCYAGSWPSRMRSEAYVSRFGDFEVFKFLFADRDKYFEAKPENCKTTISSYKGSIGNFIPTVRFGDPR